ncbi:MAG: acetyl-CoA carboxylase biotin carboxylase subunit [Gemmatimonadota bacterium]
MNKVLVANRGEIAVRIIRACREMGLRTVAVYSEADEGAPHTLLAHEAWLLGPAASSESYLRVDRLLEVARESGADAVHPGYGFLAERPHFAQAVEEAGLTFIGPASWTIQAMGDKTEARRRVAAAGVPIVPGTTEAMESPEEALSMAEEMGYPVLLKAAAGGGGKGMRVVETPQELPRALEAASREALGAFGDGAVYLERYLSRPRHIEIQLLGDAHGSVVHLGERECSIQRRHQKVVEEAPSPVITPELRAAMGAAAVDAALAVEYRGAGTVEFLYQDGEFYFLEMNTRIQVEHPVTEFITGIDLVQWQLRVARGEPLPWTQEEISFRGHALECRITAENPMAGFLPSTGSIREFLPPTGPWVRWDGGIQVGGVVGLHYDPLLGKLIVWAPSRAEAIARMSGALEEFIVHGMDTSIPFLRRVMEEPHFQAGDLSIRYLEEHPELMEARVEHQGTAGVLAALLEEERRRAARPSRVAPQPSTALPPWVLAGHPAARER